MEINTDWHDYKIFAELAGVHPVTASGILKSSFENGKPWRGFILNVIRTSLSGRCKYAVNPESYPPDLLVKWHREQTKNQPIIKDEKKELTHELRWEHYQFNLPKKDKEIAESRFKAVYAYFELIQGRGACTKGQALSSVAQAFGIPQATLRKWLDRVKKFDRADWLPALAPNWNPHKNQADCTPAAWEFFKADYLRLEKPTIKACYIRLKEKAAAEDWVIPSVDTFERWVSDDGRISVPVKTLLREGVPGLMRLYPHQERDKTTLRAMEWINGDGYKHNVFVRFPDGIVYRPKTWFWQDIHSGFILAWRVDLSENSDMIRLSFNDVAEKYGIPEHVTIDNTRAVANKWLTGGVATRFRYKVTASDPVGMFKQLGIALHFTGIYDGKGHGQAKPIERAFGIGGIGELVDKHPAFSGAYTGNSPNAKPENYGTKAVDLADFLKILEYGVNQWNSEPNRRTPVCRNQQSYKQAFDKSYRVDLIRKLSASQKQMWLLMAEKVKVSQAGTVTLEAGKGFGIGANRYSSDALIQYKGQYIAVRFDPQDLHGKISCYELGDRFIGEAVCIQAGGFGDKEAGREHNKARKQFIKATKDAAKAERKMTAIEVANQIPKQPAPETPEAEVIRPFFEKDESKNKDEEVDVDDYISNIVELTMCGLRQQASGQYR